MGEFISFNVRAETEQGHVHGGWDRHLTKNGQLVRWMAKNTIGGALEGIRPPTEYIGKRRCVYRYREVVSGQTGTCSVMWIP
jgi:hypothetical protein